MLQLITDFSDPSEINPAILFPIITEESSAEVTGSGSAMEIFSDPLVRGADAKVRLKINNLGSAQMEFITSQNNTTTSKVKITLKDQDGNLLSTGYLDQRVGGQIINTGSYAIARLNSGENITTDPIIIKVPLSAPVKVIIEAVIENTYYRYNKPEQVTAPGMKQSVEAVIIEAPYRAEATPEKTFYPVSQPVIISGKAISNSALANPQSEIVTVPNVPVKLGISVKGFDRFYSVTTDNTGAFTYTFTPGAYEAGTYSVWAVHPDINVRAVQSSFTIAGLQISPKTANIRMVKPLPIVRTEKLGF